MVSDLAPIDLLIQHASRLWRHPGRCRPVPGPELLVVGPAAVPDPGADWYASAFPKAAAVYRHHGRPWLTARELAARGALVLPRDARALVEAVYGPEASIPAAGYFIVDVRAADHHGDLAVATALALFAAVSRTRGVLDVGLLDGWY
jgi:CRISPR-associated endonuclease/helicase Cas3